MTTENLPEIFYISFNEPQNISSDYNVIYEECVERGLLAHQRKELNLTSDLIIFDGRGEFANINFSKYYYEKLRFLTSCVAANNNKCVTFGYVYEQDGFVIVKVALKKQGEFLEDDITIIEPEERKEIDAQILIDTVKEFQEQYKYRRILNRKK